MSDVITKSNEILNQIDDDYDLTVPDMRAIIASGHDEYDMVCYAFRYGYYQAMCAAGMMEGGGLA